LAQQKKEFLKKPIEKCQRVAKVKEERIDAEERVTEMVSANWSSKRISRSTHKYVPKLKSNQP
jgi:hypothetical protein